MMLAALLSTLLSLPLSPTLSAPTLDVGDLARGFGASVEQLVNAIGELEELGLPVRLELSLEGLEGQAPEQGAVVVSWRGEATVLRADEGGQVVLSLDKHRLDTLEIRLPPDLRAEIHIPWIDELGLAADCPNSEALLRAAGC